MMGVWQAGLAGMAAMGLHVAGFAFVPVAGGREAAGDGGDAVITLAASDAGVADMVAAWDAAPMVAEAPVAPAVFAEPPAMMVPTVDQVPMMPDTTALTLPVMTDNAPVLADAPTPLPSIRPKARPVQQAEAAPKRDPSLKAKPKAQGAGTAAQVAAGSGGGTQAGSGGNADAGTISGAAAADLKAQWGAAIRAKIERKKRYPAGATATGTVRLRLTVGVDGRLRGVSVAGSSGDAALDAAAVKAVQAAGRFAKAPTGVVEAANFTLNISFTG